uniref:Late endosomal/lysosomal adaptor and MAPK and MTOR activator 5 n=1 Tax=Plectus sambesii TaxID=2011161 RepID=A0A914WSM0_9BILA
MERAVEGCLNDAMVDQAVKGVTCVDASGLCLDSRGTLKGEGPAAAIAELARLARKLDTNVPASPGQQSSTTANMPVVSLEADKSRVLITQNAGVTIGIHRMT